MNDQQATLPTWQNTADAHALTVREAVNRAQRHAAFVVASVLDMAASPNYTRSEVEDILGVVENACAIARDVLHERKPLTPAYRNDDGTVAL